MSSPLDLRKVIYHVPNFIMRYSKRTVDTKTVVADESDSTTAQWRMERQPKLEEETDKSEDDGFSNNRNLSSIFPSNNTKGHNSFYGPSLKPHYYFLSEWEVAGSAIQRIGAAIWLLSVVT